MILTTRDGTEYTAETLAERIQELVDEIGGNDAPDDYVMEREELTELQKLYRTIPKPVPLSILATEEEAAQAGPPPTLEAQIATVAAQRTLEHFQAEQNGRGQELADLAFMLGGAVTYEEGLTRFAVEVATLTHITNC